eukprot:scaffold3195_cov100-Isochrysis_galbana.AAC.8
MSYRIGGSSVLTRPPHRFAPLRPNALGRRGILCRFLQVSLLCIATRAHTSRSLADARCKR